MSFMQPEICQSSFYSVETNYGTEIIPVSSCGILADTDDEWTDEQLADHFGDYIEGNTVYSAELKSGWLYRLSAPGYMDCTDTGSADTEAEAISDLLDTYGNDCGEPEDWEAELRERLAELSLPVVGQIYRSSEGAEYRVKEVYPDTETVIVARLIDGAEHQIFAWKIPSLINAGMTLTSTN